MQNHRIEQGLHLECANVLLPWGTPLSDLEHLAECEVYHATSRLCYRWDDCRCLNGLRCSVLACRFLDTFSPEVYRLYLDHLHVLSLEILEPRVVSEFVLERDFRRLLAHLEELFGPVHWCYPRFSRGLPCVFWEFPRLRMSFDIMGGFFSIGLQHEPQGYKDLRDAARASQAQLGQGPRHEGLVW